MMDAKWLIPVLVIGLCSQVYGDDSVSYYINSLTGNDNNTGTTPSVPFLTIDAAIQAAEATTFHPIYYNLFPGTFNGTGNNNIHFTSDSVVQAYKDGGTTANSVISCQGDASANTVAFIAHGEFTVDDIYFQNCPTHIRYNSNSGELAVRNSMFTTFTDVAVEVTSGDSLMIENCSFDGERASITVQNCTQVEIKESQFYGAGVSFDDVEHGVINRCDFMNVMGEAGTNKIQSIRIDHGTWDLDYVNIQYSAIDDGNSGEKGNGGSLYFSNGQLHMSNSTFDMSHAGDLGGAVYLAGSSVVIEDTQFSNSSTPDIGGAIYAVNCDLAVDRSEFTGNEADYGGAITVSGNTTTMLNDVKFQDNKAINGSCVSCCTPNSQCEATLEEFNNIESINNTNTGANGVDITCVVVNQGSSGSSVIDDDGTDGGMGTGWIILIVLICVAVVVVIGLAIAAGVVFYMKKRAGYASV